MYMMRTSQVKMAVTEPTNYTKLSKKIIQRADDLANLSPYNPVVCELLQNRVQIKVAEAFSSNHTHSHNIRNKVPACDHLQQKHQTRRSE
jgi:hypothetical protein